MSLLLVPQSIAVVETKGRVQKTSRRVVRALQRGTEARSEVRMHGPHCRGRSLLRNSELQDDHEIHRIYPRNL